MTTAQENAVNAATAADKENIETHATVFAFDIPDGIKPGVTLKVKAPDGITLHIPLPATVQGRDRLCMAKNGETGKWGIKHIERGEEPAGGQTPTAAAAAQVKPEQPKANPQPAPQMDPNLPATTRRSDVDLQRDLNDVNVCTVKIATSKGDIKIKVVPSWAPNGARRFLELVANQYYTDLAIYRAVPKFLVQFGVTNDVARSSPYEAIDDDIVRGVPITEGTVCFAACGPNTRATTLCIFLDSFKQLGWNSWETPIGKVCPESMSVLHSLHTGYGDMPQCGGKGPDPIKLEENGNGYIQASFPLCDFVHSAQWITPNTA